MAKQLKITAFMRKPKKEVNIDESGVITIDDDTITIRKYLDDDFVEEYEDFKRKKSKEVNIQHDKNVPKEPKKCPFYKKIPNTTFAVDAFSYGLIPGIKYYFLSHFHSDHYGGLRKSFPGTIVCSPITGRLVMSQIGVAVKQLIMIENHQPTMIDNVKVTLIDAFHCPGAVMFLLILPNGKRILHTGDFRAQPDMEKDIYLTEKPIDQIYLDTTYCNPNYKFPSQKETLQFILDVTLKHIELDHKLLIVCGTYSIGKEKVFKVICSSMAMSIWVSPAKLRLIKCIDDSVINENLVSDKNQAQIHILPMRDINHKFLRDYLAENRAKFSSLLAFKPTGWTETGGPLEHIKPSSRDNVHIYGVPYSEHSSYAELERFIKFFKPKAIQPTVNVGNPKTRESMFKIFANWKSSTS